MAQLILINDVDSGHDSQCWVVGGRDVPASQQGLKDSVVIARHVMENVTNIDYILSSDLARVSRILHHLRVNDKHRVMVKISENLRERNFGVLNCTNINMLGGFKSDLFQHARICAEGGESISQCSDRMTNMVASHLLKVDGNVIVLSHSFACNITFNSLLGRKLTDVYPFWLRKGSYAVLSKDAGLSPWFVFEKAFNALEDKQYSLKDIEDEFNEINHISSPAS